MAHPTVPHFHAAGRWWAADTLTSMAASWRNAIDDRLDGEHRSCAALLPVSHEGLALFVAVSARRAPAALLSHDPRFWPDRDPLFAGMPLVLPPAASPLADEARRRGFDPIVLGEPSPVGAAAIIPLRTEGFVIQTSGSTGAPKSAYRPTSHLIAGVTARNTALGLGPGDGLLGGVPLSSGQGLVQVVAAMLLGGPLGLLGPVDHRAALAAMAMPEFACWRVTPHFADVLGRCPIGRAPSAPRTCLVSSPLPDAVFERFRERYGVPLRGAYSSTETGAVSVDAASDDQVKAGTVGLPLPGVDLRVGDHPGAPLAAGVVGRIWVRSPWQMGGYGMPPLLERPGDIDGWWPTRDLGAREEDGRLRLSGRVDDCIRTREGRLVNLESVAAGLRAIHDVGAAVVLPLAGRAGASFGAVLQCAPGVSLEWLHEPITTTLQPWALPRRMVVVSELPRLANGKPDRLACLALLSGESGLA